jgi:transposase InsO family protein
MKGRAELFAGVPFLSWLFLTKEQGISADTLTYWGKPGASVERLAVPKRGLWYRYDTIPPRTRARLPWKNEAELRDAIRESEADGCQQQASQEVLSLFTQLQLLREKGYVDYRKHYQACGSEKARAYAKKYVVWAKLIQLREKHTVAMLFAAYETLEPGAYKSENSFGNALRRAVDATKAGKLIEFVRHGNEGNQHAKDTLPEHENLVRLLVSMGKGFEAPFICEKVNWMCDEMGISKKIKVDWVKKYLAKPEVMFATDGYRYGLDKARKELPYLVLESALFANDQWQLDGWHVPFVHPEKATSRAGQTVTRLARLVVFVVRDAHSRKVLGYAFGETENTALILRALRDAVQSTGKLPAELVVDNHSFNQTSEVAYLKQGLEDLGTEWTVTMNPQHKAIVERYFNLFDERFCKPVQGWIGGSPLSRKLNARPKVEVRDELKKTLYTRGKKEVIALVTHLLEQANAAPATARQHLSPNELYAQSEQPNARAVEATDLMELFWKTTACQVRRGGITLEKEGQRRYFPLPTDALQERLYKQTVVVRYDDDYERIYLFEAGTEAPICHIDRPKPVHGAKANQQGEDMGGLAKQGHLLRGIEQRKRQSNEQARDELIEKYGEMPFELVDKMSTSKPDYYTADTAHRIGQVLKDHDVNEDLLVPVRQLDPLKGTVFSQTARRNTARLGEAGRVGKPFTVSSNLGLVNQELPDEDD